ncbi:MAG: hypothetical protein ACI4J9_04245 [Mogibacterium kristiansenii]|uniref:hypothetical protein n=1 Tax=Mogibacterium kristiansenii TaxID=2606708 RepID=UPI003F0F17D7
MKTAKSADHGFSMNLDWDDSDTHAPKRKSEVAFDWSSVVDDRNSRRRPRKEVRSPWEDYSDEFESVPNRSASSGTSSYRAPEKKTSLEEELFGKEEPSRDRSRTMNFIDVLKQEKDEQERTEYENLRKNVPADSFEDTAYPERRESVLPEYQREHTQGYTDLKDDIIAEMDKRDGAATFEEQLAKIRAEREEARKQEVAPEKPQNFVEDSEQEFDRILSGMKSEKKRAPKQDNLESIFSGGSNIFEDEAPKAPEKADRNAVFHDYEDSFTSVDTPSVEDEYDNIRLNHLADEDEQEPEQEAAVKPAEKGSYDDFFFGEDDVELNPAELDDESEEENVAAGIDLFGDALTPEEPAKEESDVEDAYAGFDEYLDYVPKRRASRAARVEEPDDLDDDDEDFSLDDAAEEKTPVKETPATAEATEAPAAPSTDEKEAVDDEIAALQKKLEMLLKQKSGEAAEEAPKEPTVEVEATPVETAPEEVPAAEVLAEETAEVEAETPADDAGVDEYNDGAMDFDLEAKLDNLSAPKELEAPQVEESYSDSYMDGIADQNTGVQNDDVTPVLNIQDAVNNDAAADSAFAENEQLDLDKELAQLGFDLGVDTTPEEPKEEEIFFNAETIDTGDNKGSDTVVLPSEDILNQAAAAKDQNSMSLEDLENDIFGGAPDADDLEATRKIDKFYTLYRKNEEFQKLLDAEYSKLQGEDIDDDVTDAMNSILGTQPEAPVQEAPQAPQENPSSMSLSAAVNAAAPSAPAEAVQETGKKAKKKAKKVKEEADYDEKGGSVLTVIAIVVAVLLVVLLGIILILNFAPESGIAQTLNEVIGNYTNFFADGGGFGGLM